MPKYKILTALNEEEDEDENEFETPSQRASRVEKTKQESQKKYKILQSLNTFEPREEPTPTPDPEPEPKKEEEEEVGLLDRAKSFIDRFFGGDEKEVSPIPEFETAEPGVFSDFTVDDSQDEFLNYPSFFANPDGFQNFTQGDVDSGVFIDAADKFIDPRLHTPHGGKPSSPHGFTQFILFQ